MVHSVLPTLQIQVDEILEFYQEFSPACSRNFASQTEILHCAANIQAGEENRIVYNSFYWYVHIIYRSIF